MNVENDVEVENIFLNNVNEPEIDKPLSPTLNSGWVKSFNRKSHRKSRVNLVNRFELGKNEKTVDKQIQDFNEESFSIQENEDLLNCFERLEEIEKNRNTVYKVLLQNTKSNLTFKKPISPAPKRLKSLHSPKKTEETKLESKGSNVIQDVCEKIIVNHQSPIELPKTSNFQTATGKAISITKENIEKHSKIFEDIINSSQSDNKRQNKFSSLKKVSEGTEKITNESKISFTQEICDSGVSDTQLMCALDNVLTVKNSAYSDNNGFKGFSRKNLADSLSASCRFNSFHNVLKNSEKRKLEDSNSFSNKKLRLDIDLKTSNCGFSSASGKKFEISTQAVNKGRQIFNDLDKIGKEFQFIRACDKEISANVETKNQLNKCSNLLPMDIKRFPASTAASFDGFSKASGTKISVPVSALNKAKNVFENIELDIDLKPLMSEKKLGDSSEIKDSKSHASIKDKLKYFDKLIGDDCDFVPRSNFVLPQIEKNASNIQPATHIKNKLDYFDKLLQEEDKNDGNFSNIVKISQNLGKFSSAAGKSLQLSTLKRTSTVFDDVSDKTPFSFSTPTRSFNTSDASIKKSKRKLGISSCRQISIPESKLEKAKLIFDEDFNGISPIKHLNPIPSAPQSYNSCSTPVRNVQPSVNFNVLKEDVDIKNVVIEEISNVLKLKDDSLVTFDTLSEKNATDFEIDLKNEVKKLEERLTVMKTRHKIFEKLKEEKSDCDKKYVEIGNV